MDTMVDWAGAVRERAAAERVEVEAGEGAPEAAAAPAEVAWPLSAVGALPTGIVSLAPLPDRSRSGTLIDSCLHPADRCPGSPRAPSVA